MSESTSVPVQSRIEARPFVPNSTRLPDTLQPLPVFDKMPPSGLAKVMAIILSHTMRSQEPPKLLPAYSQSTAAERAQKSQIADVMTEASKALMPQITAMTEQQLQGYTEKQLGGELTPFFAQLQDIPPAQRTVLKDNLKGLFHGCLDRWGDLNFDTLDSKPDPETGASKRSIVTAPLELGFESAVEYGDARAQIENILADERVDNATPIVKKVAAAIIGEAREKGLSLYHEAKLQELVERETKDPAELERQRLAQEAHDLERHRALVDAMEVRRVLSKNPSVLEGERQVRKVTGKPIEDVLTRLSTHLQAGRSTKR